MAKSRAQRKAEQRRKREQELQDAARADESHAQHDTQVPQSGEVAETEARMAADAGVTPEQQAKGPAAAHDAKPPAPSRADVGTPEEAEGLSRKERRRLQKEREQAAKEQAERRAPKQPQVERERGRVATFFSSVMRELGRVQWPDRDTLVQASAVTLIFVAVAAAYLGVLDAIFSELVELII